MTWRERLVAARVSGGFTDEDRQDAHKWSSCAVGEQARMHPWLLKPCHSWPFDSELFELGGYALTTRRSGFLGAVLDGDITAAEQFLDAIEDRVLELKRHAQL